MNILPKKSWHVRNKKNIEKVRKDEEKAAEEQKEKERRIALAESEARSEVLRQVARKRLHSEIDDVKSDSVKHLNLFEDLEAGEKVPRKNKEHEEEIKREKEKQEKAIGILTYLGQGSAELEDKKPWYDEVPSRNIASSADEHDSKKKQSEDPLAVMKKYLEVTEKYEAHKKGETFEKKQNKIKNKHSDKVHNSKPSSMKSIEELRNERLARERAEKLRQTKLLEKLNKPNVDTPEPVCDERNMRYNSQFNPDLARFK